MPSLRFPLLVVFLLTASVSQVRAQALYRPKPEPVHHVPYYPSIQSRGAEIISDDPFVLSDDEARFLIKSLYPKEYRTSRVQYGLGYSSAILGSIAAFSGIMFYVVALVAPKDEYGPFSFTSGWGGAGTYCTGGGVIALAGGIVLISNAGKTTRKIINDYHATFKPKSELAFRPTSNGLGLVLSF